MNRHKSFFLLFAGVVLTSSAWAQSEVTIHLVLESTIVWDGVRSATEETGGTGTPPLAVGEPSLLYFAQGAFDANGSPTADTYQFGDGTSFRRESPLQKYATVWTFECTPNSITAELVEMTVLWEHHRSSRAGTEVVEQGSYRVALGEGQRTVVRQIPAQPAGTKFVDFLISLTPRMIAEESRSERIGQS